MSKWTSVNCFAPHSLPADNLATRGEKLELLIDKTEDLSSNVSALSWTVKPVANSWALGQDESSLSPHFCLTCFLSLRLSFQSVTFKKTSRNLARSMWWKNIKLTIIIVVVCIVSISVAIASTFSFELTKKSKWMTNHWSQIISAQQVVLYLIVCMACGGLAWQKCTKWTSQDTMTFPGKTDWHKVWNGVNIKNLWWWVQFMWTGSNTHRRGHHEIQMDLFCRIFCHCL